MIYIYWNSNLVSSLNTDFNFISANSNQTFNVKHQLNLEHCVFTLRQAKVLDYDLVAIYGVQRNLSFALTRLLGH